VSLSENFIFFCAIGLDFSPACIELLSSGNCMIQIMSLFTGQEFHGSVLCNGNMNEDSDRDIASLLMLYNDDILQI
jgi:hypothetical protein